MRTLAEQPPQTEIIDHYERAYNDATTWFAETLDGAMRSRFEFWFDGNDLIASDGGALGAVFEDAVAEAERISSKNPSLSFEVRRRGLEAQEYEAMVAMVRGEAPDTLVVVSDFPPELMNAASDVGGYNVSRKQTMLRVLAWDGTRLTMHTQSLDGSNRTALEAIYGSFGLQPQPGELLGQRIEAEVPVDQQPYLIDRLTGVYDNSLTEQFGGDWYAGRQGGRRNTLGFVTQQQAIIDRFVERQLDGAATQEDFYNTAALLAEIFEEARTVNLYQFTGNVATMVDQSLLESQLVLAGERASAAGKTFSGCGASASPTELTASQQLEQAGYGNLSHSDEDKFGPLTFKCKNGHTNRRPRGKLIKHCRVNGCKNSVAC